MEVRLFVCQGSSRSLGSKAEYREHSRQSITLHFIIASHPWTKLFDSVWQLHMHSSKDHWSAHLTQAWGIAECLPPWRELHQLFHMLSSPDFMELLSGVLSGSWLQQPRRVYFMCSASLEVVADLTSTSTTQRSPFIDCCKHGKLRK